MQVSKESVKNSQQHRGNEANVLLQISTLFPGYILTSLDAWKPGNISYHITFIRMFFVSFNLQLTICSIQFAVCCPHSAVYNLRSAVRSVQEAVVTAWL